MVRGHKDCFKAKPYFPKCEKNKTCFEYVYLTLWIWTEEDSYKADQAIAVYKAVTLKLQGWWIPTQEHKILRKGTFGLDL